VFYLLAETVRRVLAASSTVNGRAESPHTYLGEVEQRQAPGPAVLQRIRRKVFKETGHDVVRAAGPPLVVDHRSLWDAQQAAIHD